MADPFAIISLVDTVFGLGCKVYDFFSAVKDAPLEIRSFANELSVFNSVLQEVKEYVKAFRTSGFSTRDELNLELVGVTLKQCNAELWDIYDAVKDKDAKQSLSFLTRLGSSSSWVFNKEERVKSTERLNRARDTLTVVISTSLGRQNIVIRDEMHLAREDITAINKSQQEVISLLSAMFAAGQERVKSLDSRADEEKTRSETRLGDISDKFQAEFEAFSLRNSADDVLDAAAPEQPSPNADGNSEGIAISSGPSPREQRRAYSAIKPSEVPQQMEALKSALRNFETQLSMKDRVQLAPLLDTKTSQDFLLAIVDQLYKSNRKRIGKKGSLSKLVDTVQPYLNVVETMAGSEITPLVWGSVSLIMQAASRWKEDFDSLMEMLEETGEVMRLCEREYELYQNSMTKEPLMKLYTEFLDFCQRTIRILQAPAWSSWFRRSMIMQSARPELQNSISRIRKISASVRNEAEFQGRVELRHAHERIVTVEVQQQKMLAVMEDQKKILASLAEERRLVTMMKDQQTILQTLQQLQMRLQEMNNRNVVVNINDV
ncbi:hypothetical protein GQX73_g1638 [Xylaria multiplex]|uniref:DUF7708 domain-containing protein n=1 Tax=Xylaria multiplex TaxID=323545 RepID=A0A7C8MRQ2_9PEZI|nr:hypothetical protein GQX73_g1638 [Xylaria multiplex]